MNTYLEAAQAEIAKGLPSTGYIALGEDSIQGAVPVINLSKLDKPAEQLIEIAKAFDKAAQV